MCWPDKNPVPELEQTDFSKIRMFWSDEELVPRPVPATDPEPEPSFNLSSGDSIPSQSLSGAEDSSSPAIEVLPVPTERTDQCRAASVMDIEPFPTPTPVSEPALLSVPEHSLDLPSGDLLSANLLYQS
ncbi:ral guanine nucleotide dissociation stimulator-like [Macrobrachium rosenbergii]|uniref:ral guanine nucleotide dissociation stimulator-like n=1 Tax=Macrobrachium rosenbergii TaxID=79674 RepID=UPI0034D5C0C4